MEWRYDIMKNNKMFYSLPNRLDLEGCRLLLWQEGNQSFGLVKRLVIPLQIARGRRPLRKGPISFGILFHLHWWKVKSSLVCCWDNGYRSCLENITSSLWDFSFANVKGVGFHQEVKGSSRQLEKVGRNSTCETSVTESFPNITYNVEFPPMLHDSNYNNNKNKNKCPRTGMEKFEKLLEFKNELYLSIYLSI